MKILLVMPPPFETGRLGLENVVWLSEPVALTSVAAAVPEHDVKIMDLRLEPEDALVKMLGSWRPDIVGTTSMTTDAYQAKAVLRTSKKVLPETLTIIGGHHPTLCPDEFDCDFVDVIVQGEGELTFKDIVGRYESGMDFEGVLGIRWLHADGRRRVERKRHQTIALDELPTPDRSLIKHYHGRYFFTAVSPMASIFTSRGCSFDCNFCAIWEFYERRVRYLSAKGIADQMEACDEPYVFVLDDNFLVNKKRILALCEELETRKIKKFWMTQGRCDFVADNPEIMKRLADNGLVGLLSGYESNDEDSLKALRKKSSWDKNIRANDIMADLGIFSTGIFMVRPDWTEEQFDGLYEYINSLTVGIPLITILTPLPGTQLYRSKKDQLLTHDHRLFDLLHPVLPTRLPRDEFYKQFARSVDAVKPSIRRALTNFGKKHPRMVMQLIPNIMRFYARTFRYQAMHRDYRTFLRDEEGLLIGPGVGLNWEDIHYPDAEEPQPLIPSRVDPKKLVAPPLWAQHESLDESAAK
jgi:hopanoid C-3 methylase